MRILVVHHRYRVRGGEDQAVDREVALLRSGGQEVELWERDSREISGFASRVKVGLSLSYSEQSRFELFKKLEAYRPDIVHVHNWFPSFTPSIYDACLDARIPVVQTQHNYRIFCANGLLARDESPCELCLGGNTWPSVKYACYQNSRVQSYLQSRMISYHRKKNTWNAKVDQFIALSEFSAEKLAEGGIQREKIRIKPNFAFPPDAGLKRKPEGYALYIGRLSEEKGLRTLMKAWSGREQPLFVAGDGPLRRELEAQNNPAVKFLGALPFPKVTDLMSRADFLVLPSECYENFPLVVAEAFSLGLPVIASRLGSLAEIVRDGVNGISFTAGNVAELREKIRRVSSDAELRECLAQGALADYAGLYTPAVNLEQLLKIYREVIAARVPA
jgi:glycosyltransferase involved in cell wall biosynthesis